MSLQNKTANNRNILLIVVAYVCGYYETDITT